MRLLANPVGQPSMVRPNVRAIVVSLQLSMLPLFLNFFSVRAGRTPIGASAGEQWVHVGSRRSHTHDVRALAIAIPRSLSEDIEASRNQHR
jgi:hypothetical protein